MHPAHTHTHTHRYPLSARRHVLACRVGTHIPADRGAQPHLLGLRAQPLSHKSIDRKIARHKAIDRKQRTKQRTGDFPGLARTTAHKQLKTLPGRLELPTLRLTASRSNQLSYGSAHASLQINDSNKAKPNTRCTIRCHRSSVCWCKIQFLDARSAVAQ